MRERLVRDRKPELHPELTFRPVTGADEHVRLLMAKLLEEASEVLDAIGREDNVITELVDVFEVVKAMAAAYGCSGPELIERAMLKRMAFGGFNRGTVYIEYRLADDPEPELESEVDDSVSVVET